MRPVFALRLCSRGNAILALAGLLICFAPPGRVAAYTLEHDLSTRLVEIRTNFRGASFAFFGVAQLDEMDGDFAGGRPDLIVIVRGPPQTFAVRQKERSRGIWANRESRIAHDVPGFYFIASTRPVEEIADPEILERHGIGETHLGINLKPSYSRTMTEPDADLLPLPGTAPESSEPITGPIAPGTELQALPAAPGPTIEAELRAALIRLLKERRTFVDRQGELRYVRDSLFRIDVDMPAVVPLGAYMAEVYLLHEKAIVSAQFSNLYVDKKGIERTIYEAAQENSISYGILSVLLAAGLGWLGAYLFRRK